MQRQQHDLSDVLNLGVERGPVHLGINHEGCVFGSEPSHYAVCIICPLRALIDEEHSRERFGMAWERKDTITSGLSILAIFVSAYSLYKTSIFKELKVRASVAGLSDLKPPQAAAGKSRGGERCGNAETRFRQARSRTSEPLMKCRKPIRRCRNRGVPLPPGSARENPEACPSGIRHAGGAKLNQALVRNVRTCRSDAKGDVQAAHTARTRVPKRSTGAEQLVVGMKAL